MNTQTPDVPEFKLAKVGRERKRRGGGASWSFGGRGAGGFSGATGGAGGLSALFAGGNLGLMIVIAISVAASWILGAMEAAQPVAKAPGKSFVGKSVAPTKYDDLSGVVKAENSIPNSLGYLKGDPAGVGMPADEAARRKAEEEAAAKKAAEEEAARKAEEDAKQKDAAANPAGAPPGLDGKALSKFRQLSSGFSGGKLNGGAGLSGGVAQGFGSGHMKGKDGAISSFGRSYRAGTAATPSAPKGRPSRAKGLARRQLDDTYKSTKNLSSSAAPMRAQASAPFDNNNGAAGYDIGGPGLQTNSGQTSAPGTPNTANNNSGSSTLPPDDGDCPSGMHLNSNGFCDPDAPQSQNAAAYQKEIDVIKTLMMVVTILSLFAMAIKYFSWTPLGFMLPYIMNAISVIGGMICILGARIMTMGGGDKMIGGISAAIGAFICWSAWGANENTASMDKIIDLAAKPLIASALGYLYASGNSHPSQ